MEGKRLPEPRRVDLLRGVQQVRRGLAVEAEGAVAVLRQTYKGEGGVGGVGKCQMGQVNAAGGKLLGDPVPKRIVAQLGQQGAFAPQTGKGTADVGRCAPYPGAEGRHLVKGAAGAGGDHIDERLTDGK